MLCQQFISLSLLSLHKKHCASHDVTFGILSCSFDVLPPYSIFLGIVFYYCLKGCSKKNFLFSHPFPDHCAFTRGLFRVIRCWQKNDFNSPSKIFGTSISNLPSLSTVCILFFTPFRIPQTVISTSPAAIGWANSLCPWKSLITSSIFLEISGVK